jgi:hypothetical protein
MSNNTFAFPNPMREGHILLGSKVVGAKIVNNLFYQPSMMAAINVGSADVTNIDINHNLIDGGVSVFGTGLTSADTLQNTSAMLVDPANFDFHLMDGSLAIDKGAAVAGVTQDFDGRSRPQGAGFDIGAFEHP